LINRSPAGPEILTMSFHFSYRLTISTGRR
jgi:hypothetical protein